jgi:hypothetical protein
MRDSTEYENGMWSGRINHFTDRCKTLKQISKESGYKYALGYKEGREWRKSEHPNAEVSDGGPLTHDKPAAQSRRSLH